MEPNYLMNFYIKNEAAGLISGKNKSVKGSGVVSQTLFSPERSFRMQKNKS